MAHKGFGIFGLALWAGLPLAAEGVQPGTYDVAGIDSDGTSPYLDEARLTIAADGGCRLDYGVAPDVLEGICMIDGDWIAASSVAGGHWMGLFRQVAEGRIEGRWRIEGEPGTGREILSLRK